MGVANPNETKMESRRFFLGAIALASTAVCLIAPQLTGTPEKDAALHPAVKAR
jgi:hypothetical protein